VWERVIVMNASAATGQAVSYGAGGNRVAGVSVRSVVDVRPEHVEAAAALLVVSSHAAVVVDQPEPVVCSSRVAGENPRVRESGMPFCFCKPPPCR